MRLFEKCGRSWAIVLVCYNGSATIYLGCPQKRALFYFMNQDKLIYAAVLRRASRLGYPKCEECGSNGSDWPLEVAHIKAKGMGGSKFATTVDNVKMLCYRCHREKYHGERIVD